MMAGHMLKLCKYDLLYPQSKCDLREKTNRSSIISELEICSLHQSIDFGQHELLGSKSDEFDSSPTPYVHITQSEDVGSA